MFEKTKKNSSRVGTSKSSSRNKIPKKDLHEGIITNNYLVYDLGKTHKSKSQCLPKQRISNTKIINSKSKNSMSNPSKKNFQQKNYIDSLPTEQHKKKFFYQGSNTQKPAEVKWVRKSSFPKKSNSRSIERQKLIWNEKKTPYTWEQIGAQYSHFLTKFQSSQIKQFQKIYYIGHKAKKKEKIQFYESGFDNDDKQYNYIVHDHIAYRYQILQQLGKGSYGQVFKVYDHKRKQELALKMIKNRSKFSKQAFIQIKILTYIKQQDPQNISNVVRIKDFVIFRKHVCLVFQLLSQNLYQLIIRNNYNGLKLDLIRRFAIQLLTCLCFLHKHKIIHCDLKPQNILLKQYNKSGIRIIDFGSSCFTHQILYTYIQSRYYRAPQITLGLQYDSKIDIWSAGCILGQLFTGVPIFPGQNQLDQMKYLVNTLGMPPKQMAIFGNRSEVFFTKDYKLKPQVEKIEGIQHFNKKLIERINDEKFRKFIQLFLVWNPKERISAAQALKHEWILQGLPEQLKHLNFQQDIQNYRPRKSKSKSHEKITKHSLTLIPNVKNKKC